jgi:UDP-N-acetylmuramoyl-tripeptide--D-alanyl-D-alanine ligase
MGELGEHSAAGHQRVGEVAAEVGVDALIGVGPECAWTVERAKAGGVAQVAHVESAQEAVNALKLMAKPGDVVLVKGSRSARMERIVEGLQPV